jgi:hypothetical protein
MMRQSGDARRVTGRGGASIVHSHKVERHCGGASKVLTLTCDVK